MAKEYWITNSRFKLIVIIMVLMWIGVMTLFYLKADEVTKDPCSICSKYMGEEVICTSMVLGNTVPARRIYYPNGTVFNDLPLVFNPESFMNFDFKSNETK